MEQTMKTLFLLVGVMALMVGCSTTDNNMGATGDEYFDESNNKAEGIMNSSNPSSTGVLDIGTGAAGMGVGTGIGSGSTGSGLP
jgi:hypothetical protein